MGYTMTSVAWKSTIYRTSTLLVVAVALTGCAHVKPDELDARLTGLRSEMQDEMARGDQSVAGDVTTLEGRVSDMESRVSTLERELTRLAQEFDATVERLETALRFDLTGGGACLAIADGVVRIGEEARGDGPLAFVPDSLIADEPAQVESVKRGLREAYRRLCDLEWDTLLLAHGHPLVGDGKEKLRAFAGG